MKIFITIFLCCSLFFSPFVGFSEPRSLAIKAKLEEDSGKNIGTFRALIIGIDNYEDEKIPDLKTAANDAESVAKLLKKSYGFTDVTLLLNGDANNSSIVKNLRKIANNSKSDDSVLIYYAGHGELDKLTKDGYWIPSDAVAQDPSTYLDNSVIQKYVKAIPARHVLLISDSCFSGSLFGEARALPSIIDDKYYANLFKEKSRWGMTSGNLTPVSDSGSAGHSVFAYHFLKKLANNRKSYITPREIYQDIAPIISNNSSQMPIAKPLRNAEDQGGEFIFLRSDLSDFSQDQKPKAVIAGADTATLDVTFWNSIKESNDPSMFQAYLDEFPEGTFSRLARIRLKQLAKEKECCFLIVRSNVAEDMVYIDGKAKRGTSKEPFPLKPGTYSVEVRKPGYETWGKDVTVNEQAPSVTLYAKLLSHEPRPSKLVTSTAKTPSVTKNVVEPEMVFVKGGCFQMGDSFDDYRSFWGEASIEKPLHEVCVNDFYLGKYEVTQKEWEAIMGSNPAFHHKGSYLPIVDVSWKDVQEFLKKLKDQTGKNYSLPTEAEWEFACREGGKKVRFGTGEDAISADEANFNASAEEKESYSRVGENRKKPSAVGSFTPNALGLHDMSGNVWEWGLELYNQKDYSLHGRDNPLNESDGTMRVVRGGSWVNAPYYSRCSARNGRQPEDKNFDVGFRVILRSQDNKTGKLPAGHDRYIDHGDGTITDTKTGLMWAKKDSYADLGDCLDWNAAKQYVSSLAAGGYHDWRMPTIDELQEIYEEGKTVMAYSNDPNYQIHNDPIFAKGGAYRYWSVREGRGIYFGRDGAEYYEDEPGFCPMNGVRAVRSP